MPKPIGFVSSSSATCCIAPGFSTESLDRSTRASTVPTRSTTMAIMTCSGMGSSGLVIHEFGQPGNVFSHSLTRGTQDFIYARRHRRGSKSTQACHHAQKGNLQNLKNNIHGEGYQPVAKDHAEVIS